MIKICKMCQKEFEATSKLTKYCGYICVAMARADSQAKYKAKYPTRHKEHIKKYNDRPILSKICSECGKPFKTRTKNKMYCQTNCYIGAKRTEVKLLHEIPIKRRLTAEESTKMLIRAAHLFYDDAKLPHEIQNLSPEKLIKLNLNWIEVIRL